MALNNTATKILIILFLCFIPWVLVIMWTASFIKKTKSDECNAENYQCEPPIKGQFGFSKTTQFTPTPSQSASSNISADEQAALNALKNPTITKKENFITGTTDLEATQCGEPIKISGPTVNSSATFNGMKIMSIISIVVMVIISLVLIKVNVWGITGGDPDITVPKSMGIVISSISLISLIMISIFLGMKNKLYTSAGFHTSIIGTLLIIICFIKYFTPSSWPTWSIVAYSVLGLLTVLMIFGTIFIHTFQKDNLLRGKYTHAVNESIAAIVPPVMILYVIGSVLFGVGIIATKQNLSFGITQIISAILLLACVIMYYKYKTDCKESVQICRNVALIQRINKQTLIPVSACVPDTGMSIKPKTILNMGIAMSVLMGINHLVGGLIIGFKDTNFFKI